MGLVGSIWFGFSWVHSGSGLPRSGPLPSLLCSDTCMNFIDVMTSDIDFKGFQTTILHVFNELSLLLKSAINFC